MIWIPAAVASVKFSQMSCPCESIRWRRASADTADLNSQPVAPQRRRIFSQFASWTLRFLFGTDNLQYLQGNGTSFIRRRNPGSTWVMNGLFLQNGHSRIFSTCSSHRNCVHCLQDTGFFSTEKQIGHSNELGGRLFGSRSAQKQ